MHRDVRRVGHQIAIRAEYGAGKVEPFLYVDRMRCVAQHDSGLLGDRHEQVVEYLKHDGIGFSAERGLAGTRLDAVQHQMVAPGDLSRPARFDDGGRVSFDDYGGTEDSHARLQLSTVVNRRVLRTAGHMSLDLGQGLGCAASSLFEVRVGHLGRTADDLDRNRLDEVPLFRRDKAILLLVSILELGDHASPVVQAHHEG